MEAVKLLILYGYPMRKLLEADEAEED